MDHLSDDTLNELLDQALEPSARASADAHLATCADCAARLAALRSLFAQLESLPDLPLERDLSASVVSALRRPAPALLPAARRAPWLAGLIFAGQAAAAVILLAFAWPVAAAFVAQLPIPTAPGLSSLLSDLSRLLLSLRGLTADPLNLWHSFQQWAVAAPTAITSLLPAWLNPLEAALLVAAAALIGLLGNALILTPPFLARLRRNS